MESQETLEPYKWHGKEKDLINQPLREGYIYFTDDSNKLFVDLTIDGTLRRKEVKADTISDADLKIYNKNITILTSDWIYNEENNKSTYMFSFVNDSLPYNEIFQPINIFCLDENKHNYQKISSAIFYGKEEASDNTPWIEFSSNGKIYESINLSITIFYK